MSILASMNNEPQILLWGARSQARIIEEMIKEEHMGQVKIIFDNTLEEPTFESKARFINDIQNLKNKIQSLTHFVVCIAGEHGLARFKTAHYLEKLGLKPLTLIHKTSFIEATAHVGIGCQIMPCAVIHKFSRLGAYTVVNTNATIDHECDIGNGVHIMGNAAITGKVTIGDYATIGTNATILPFINIGKGAFIGAGAVVTKDVAPYDVVVGMPAKKMKTNELKFYEHVLIELADKKIEFVEESS